MADITYVDFPYWLDSLILESNVTFKRLVRKGKGRHDVVLYGHS